MICAACNQEIRGKAIGRMRDGKVVYTCATACRHIWGFLDEGAYRPDPLSKHAPAYIPFKALDRSIGRMGRPLDKTGKPRKDKRPSNVD